MIGARLDNARRQLASRLDPSPLAPWWHRSRGWWNDRTLREQVLIGGLAAVASFALLLVGVIVPLRSVRDGAYTRLHEAALLDAQLRTGVGTGTGQHAGMQHGTASAILTDSAAAARLSIQRMEPEGGNTRVELGDAPFGQVMTWIAEVERTSRLRVQQAQIDRKPSPGVVSASFVFAG